MCGILGAVNINFGHETLDLLKHRGPDFGDIKSFRCNDATITLGHRRLSIVDLSASGNQPMRNDQNGSQIIFNGEIYNHLSLKESLSEYTFNGHSDTETILYYISKFGIDSVEKFNGIFSFSYLDVAQKKLYLVRDPFGVKPLYYYHNQEKLVFASEIRPIKSLIDAEITKDQLAQLLKVRYSSSPDTIYSHILKLRPGHILEYDLVSHAINIRSFQKPVHINPNAAFHKAIDQYGELLENAVIRQLMSDVEIGILLSGGIDSAVVGYFMQKHLNISVKSFTVGFEGNSEENELNDARESAEILGTDHREIIINEDNFQEVFEKTINIIEEPLGTTSSIPMYFLNREVANHLKVVLTGQGADEPLGGYQRYKGVVMGERIPKLFFKALQPVSHFIKNEKISRAINAFGERDIIKRLENAYMLFTDSELIELIKTEDKKNYQKISYFYNLLECQNKKTVEAMMSIDSRMNLADDLLLYTDKISMHFGIETRVPFLDHDLMYFLESLPYEFKIKNGEGKYLHKEFAKTILPEKIINRKKKGFLSPTNQWFKDKLGELMINEIEKKDNEFLDFFDLNKIRYLLRAHKDGYNKEKQLFLLLSTFYWFKLNAKNS